MLNGLFGLRHDAVIGGHNNNHDIRDLGAARPHGGKRRVSRSIQKGNRAMIGNHLISPDMLGNSSRFTGSDPGGTNVIE